MNKEKITILILMVLVLFSALSVVSATDNAVNNAISGVDGQNTIEMTDDFDALKASSATFNQLDGVVQSAGSGATVVLDRNYTYAGDGDKNGIVIDNDLTIDGAGFTLNGAGHSSIFKIMGNSQVTLKNINFINAYGVNGSAVSFTADDSVSIINSKFINNTALTSGGAVYIANTSTITANSKIVNSLFINNKAANGGAISARGTLLDVLSSRFTNNSASNNGGSIFFDIGIYLNNSVFINDHAGVNGGALYLYSTVNNISTLSPEALKKYGLYSSTFIACSAGTDGGFAYIYGNRGTVNGMTVINCTAGRNGGGAYIDGDRGVVSNCTFINNTASQNGGALVWSGINGMIYGCNFINNTAQRGNGAGIYQKPEDDVSVFDGITIINASTFSNNVAYQNGGAIYVSGIFAVIHHSLFTKDEARDGAGIYLDVGASIEYCTLIAESAKNNGGAIYLSASNIDTEGVDPYYIALLRDNVGVRHSTIINCSAAYDGGAGYVAGNNGVVVNITMIGNSAGHDGGAGYISGNFGKLYNSTIINNRAARDGGALTWTGNGGVIDNVTFMLNRADGGSGSICVRGSNSSISRSVFTLSNATLNGGAIYVYGHNVNITDSLFDKCAAAAYHGGAVFVEGSDTYIKNCNFTMNRVNVGIGQGGALNVLGNGTQIIDCNFDRCTASKGGFVYVAGDDVKIINVTGMHSFAARGGAFYIEGDKVQVHNVDFEFNNATEYAGALYIAGDFANITDITLAKNIAYNRDGGAIYIEGLNTTIINAELIQNRVTGANAKGGAVYVKGDFTKILNSTFEMCTAYDGGVLYIDGDYALIDGYSCLKSLANNDGGAMYVAGDYATIADFNIALTNATNYGGAIYVAGNYLNIHNSNFTRCTAYNHNGGAIYVLGLNTTIYKSHFTMNMVNNQTGCGGSIAIHGNNTKILNSTFRQCNAYDGGVIYINGSNTLIDGYSCIMSFAANNGGAIFVEGNYANIADFNISLTNATNYGGAIYVAGDFTKINNSSFTRCIADNYDGGALYIAGANATVSNSKFLQNRVNQESGRGGSVDITGNYTKLLNCTFIMCTAFDGGVVNIEGSHAYIDGFVSNMTSATNQGGALYIAGDHATVNHFNIGYSNATYDGGVIYITGEDDVNILNGVINTCIARYGDGGAFYLGGYNTTVINCSFDRTQALNSRGGAIFIEGDLALVKDSNFVRSFANTGGIIYILGANASIINDNLTYSWTVESGGSIYIEGDDVLIKDSLFAFANASSSKSDTAGFGGAIFIYGNNVNITSSVFFKNIAEGGGSGGAIYIMGENANIEKSNFTYCISPDYDGEGGGFSAAGAIAIGGDDASIRQSNFKYCTSRNGGVMFIAGSNAQIIDLNITRCSATNDGGALYIFGDHTNVSGTSFDHVKSERAGGAVYIRFGEYSNIENSNFTFCNSTTGGAIDIDGNDIRISSSNMVDCYGVEDGGAIYISGNNVTMLDSNFTRCFVQNNNGGAIYWIGSIGFVNNTYFINNTSPRLGGAIFMRENSKITFDFTHFINNTAGINGGAIDFNRGAHDEVIFNSTFINNKANRSAGAVFWFGTNGTIKDSVFINNTALGIVNYTDSYGNVTYGGYGGAVMWTGAQGIVDNCTFINNYAQYNNATKSGGRGGAVYLQGSDVGNGHDTAFYNSLFINNTAGYNGGAVDWFRGAANGCVENSTFINNTAHRSGGGIYWSGINGTIRNSTFINNTATGDVTDANGGGDGGAVLWVGPEGFIDRVYFENNTAAYSGGAIYLKGSDNGTDVHCNDVFVDHGVFKNNRAGLNGGAVDFQQGATNGKLSNSVFINNTALRNGGALFWYGHNGTVFNTTFSENEALGLVDSDARGVHKYIDENGNPILGGSGGAISWIGDIGKINDSTFTDNTARRLGGAVFLRDNSFTTFANDKFTNNTAGINGGAVDFNRGAHDGAIINSTFENNVANRSAGAVFWFGTNGTIKDSTFKNNTALGLVEYKDSYGDLTYGGNGGAVQWTGAKGLVDNCKFEENSAARRGGAVYLQGSDAGNCTDSTFSFCEFANNLAGTNGGAVDWHEGAHNGNVFNSTFENNTANANGGAVYWRGHDGEIIGSTFTNNTAKGLNPGSYGNVGDGGAIFWAGLNGLVDDCRFTDNEAVKNPDYDVGGRGGAVYIEPCDHGNKNTTFKNVYFADNVAGTNGGAIDWHAGAEDGLVDNATFINNTAKRSAGAIFWNGHNGTIKYSKFYANKALGITNATSVLGDITYGGDGGAVMWSGALGNVIYSNFVNNTAAKRGGAVFLQGSEDEKCDNTTFRSSYFANNVAGYNGGAIDWYHGARHGIVDNSTFVNNAAKRSGGGIYWSGIDGTIKDSTFTNNTALGNITDANGGGDGGAVLWVGQNGIINGSKFKDNRAAYSGGAVFLKGSDDGGEGHCNNVAIDNGLFENNFAGLNGGAVDFQEGATNGRLSNSNLINNTALRNGGAVFWYGHNGTVKSCNFTDNKALGLVDEDARGVHKYIDSDGNKVLGGSGGAVSWIGDIGSITDCNFIKNNAEKLGGAVFLRDNLYTTFNGANFTNNSAKQGGAIYWKSQSNEILTDCILTGNVASKGSAIYLAKNNLEIIDSVLLNNKADSQDLVLNVTKTNNNQTIDVVATLRGNDNLVNAIWNDGTIGLTNVTYLGIDGVTNTGSERRVPVVLADDVKPGDYDNIYQTQYEDYQDITFYIYDRQNNLLTAKTVKTNISGMARFKYASSSDKLYELVFHPNDNYYTGIENSTSKKLAYAIIPATDIYYLENESFVISIVDRQNETVPSGNVTVLLNGAEIGNFTLDDGKTPQIVLTSLPCGTYNVTVKYTGSEDFFQAINSTTFKVMKIASFIIPTIENYTYGEKGKMIIKVPENETNTISINLNGKTFEVKVNESGCAEFEIPELDFGVYEVELDYPETNNYFKSANRTSFEIYPAVDLNIVKSANAREIYVDEEITYTIVVYNAGLGNATNVKVSEKLSKSLKFISADTEYGYYNENEGVWYVGNLNSSTTATLTLTVKAISAGEVKNTVSVGALEKDLNSSDNNFTCENVTVIQRDSPIEIDVKDITYGEAIVITVKAPKDSNGTVNITVCGETYNDLPVYDGQIVFEYDSLAGGDYDVDVTFSGDNKYKPNSTHASFNVAKLTPEIKIEVVDIKEGEIEVLNVTVNAPGTVLITVDGLTIEIPLEDGVKTTDVLALGNTLNYDGKATWNLINLPLGAHNAFAVYKGNENYTSVNTSAVFHVRADVGDVSVIISDIKVGDDEIINIKYPEDATGDVTIIINGKSYTKSLRNGEVTFTIPKLKAGKYKFGIYYSGDDKYLPNESEGSFKVSKVKIKLTEDNIDFDGKKFTVTLPSDAEGTVTIEIDGKVYTKAVKNGKAVFELSGLKYGDYSIFVSYSGDDKYDEVSESFMINVDFDKGSGATHEGKSYGKLSSERVNLSDYATGNPVWIILLICALIGLIRPRRYRK